VTRTAEMTRRDEQEMGRRVPRGEIEVEQEELERRVEGRRLIEATVEAVQGAGGGEDSGSSKGTFKICRISLPLETINATPPSHPSQALHEIFDFATEEASSQGN
jgi:hypothetical protein